MSNGIRETNYRAIKKARIDASYPGGLAQLRADWQAANTWAAAKPIVGFVLRLLLGV